MPGDVRKKNRRVVFQTMRENSKGEMHNVLVDNKNREVKKDTGVGSLPSKSAESEEDLPKQDSPKVPKRIRPGMGKRNLNSNAVVIRNGRFNGVSPEGNGMESPSESEEQPKLKPVSFTQSRSGKNRYSFTDAALQPLHPNTHQLKQQRKEVRDLARELVRFNPTLKGKIFAPKRTVDENGNACLVIDTSRMSEYDKTILAGLKDKQGRKLFSECRQRGEVDSVKLFIIPTPLPGEKTFAVKGALSAFKQHREDLGKLKLALIEWNPDLKDRINSHKAVDKYGIPALVIRTEGMEETEIERLREVKDSRRLASFIRPTGQNYNTPNLKFVGHPTRVVGVIDNIEAITDIEHTLKHFSFRFRHGFEVGGDGSVTFENSHVNKHSKQSQMMKSLLTQAGWVQYHDNPYIFNPPVNKTLKIAASNLCEKAKQPSKTFQLQQQLG